ncbi:MAG: ABC transporter ATP-binding protein [Rhodoplanes sp.]|uniref:ABC transporter ATP-binding protein n=1 Tax=Rhodoplanes sp. TaxID=1968906 RepID=UPI0018114EA1|nr:ABC transporter ATP-binding protein [Rhodoplanes sp.]NVO17411.1 ABC transporter ATP-binding protein [Rhodoplanes sp.]
MTLLTVSGLHAGYGRIEVVHGIDLAVDEGSVVALLGTNGAGKTTTMRAIAGQIPARGSILLDGTEIAGRSAAERVRLGIAHIPQGRGTFSDFSVEENLRLGAYTVGSRRRVAEDMDHWFTVFPILRERRRQSAGSLSGGEQQMLAIARALMSRPRLLLCDEPSLGLAPTIVRDVFKVLADLNASRGLAILVVEQNADLSLAVARHAYVMTTGTITMSGPSDTLRQDFSVRHAYLGV